MNRLFILLFWKLSRFRFWLLFILKEVMEFLFILRKFFIIFVILVRLEGVMFFCFCFEGVWILFK